MATLSRKIAHYFIRCTRRWISLDAVCSEVTESLQQLPALIHKELVSESQELQECSRYLFDGRGKAIRPTMVLLMAATCNYTRQHRQFISLPQQTIAMVTEMIHTASLIHDDIIDGADTRRGKPSVNKIWGERKAVMAGNFILAEASRCLASLGNAQVIDIVATVIEDLVRGEVMQLNNTSGDAETLFEQYIHKTFKKTASLMAYSCQAVAVLSNLSEEYCQAAFQYGKNAGLAFQIIDDVLDFQATESEFGKPVSVDLKLGLSTAPVLFAAKEVPELYKLMRRQFKEPGDVEKAVSAVLNSSAIKESLNLAQEYSSKSIGFLNQFTVSPERNQLYNLANEIVDRNK